MVFTTNIFMFIFLPVVLCGYCILRKFSRKISKAFLMLSSVVFYAWDEPKCLLIFAILILVNYNMAILIDIVGRKQQVKIKRMVLAVSVAANLFVLFFFKYTNFLIQILNNIQKNDMQFLDLLVPLGVSYFTFSGISYIVDVYHGKAEAERNMFDIALYMLFFPKVTAGPIIRYTDISKQMKILEFNAERLSNGVRRFCVGFAKKVLIADQLGKVADEIFSVSPSGNLPSVAWLGIICYTLQIYHDFSGYSDMAIGLAKMFGIDFKENFNYPYISKSLTEFWRRWHISLSSWFRDYLYIPLGGNRKGNVYVNSAIVFLATGIWHGASWNFIFWGIWHGIFLIIEKFTGKHMDIKIPVVVKRIYTILAVMIGWVFFRCATFSDGFSYVLSMFNISSNVVAGYSLGWYLTPKIMLIILIGIFCSLPIANTQIAKKVKESAVFDLAYMGLLIAGIVAMMSSTYNSFIYFKF